MYEKGAAQEEKPRVSEEDAKAIIAATTEKLMKGLKKADAGRIRDHQLAGPCVSESQAGVLQEF